jgi:hypothetical protein
MKYTTIFFAIIFFTAGCNNEESDVSHEINEINKAIDDNIKKAEENNYKRDIEPNLDGPYPADEYSFKPTGKFHIQAVYVDGKDSTWMIFSSKTEDEILKKYTKLKAYKIRPTFISRDSWMTIRQDCIRENMIFDIADKPKGWLISNENLIK